MLFRYTEADIAILGHQGGEETGVKQGLLEFLYGAKRLEDEFLEEILLEDSFKLAGCKQFPVAVVGVAITQVVYSLEPFRAHQGQVNRAPECEQRLIRADVGCGLLPADMLLPGLEGQ